MLIASHISKSFNVRSVLEDVSFQMPQGSINGLIGPSGCGKSVLLKIIAQIIRPDSGTIQFCDQENFAFSLMFQEGALFDSLSVLDNVAFPLVQGHVPHTLLPRAQREQVREQCMLVLKKVGLGNAAQKLPGQLSGGMRRRASLARALVSKSSLLLLDDPTCGLDPVASSVIMNLIGEIHAEYQPTLIIVSHDLRRLFPLVQNVFALFDGRITYTGPVSDIQPKGSVLLKRFVSARYELEKRHDLDKESCIASPE
jgi:phospholipid/cholesterol/gamma-HCH transport system ATP-binding protein